MILEKLTINSHAISIGKYAYIYIYIYITYVAIEAHNPIPFHNSSKCEYAFAPS
jgi:hypothetical protein